jgi:succinate dehydrogenase/fumarate reductase flavoprotein subunit
MGGGSSVIIGGGLAGWATAIKLKKQFPEMDVVLVEKSTPQSNTQGAGMRIRFGITHRRQNPYEEMVELFASRNRNIVTEPMEIFARTAVGEVPFWQSIPGFVGFEDNEDWFGPQWGVPNAAKKGRGKSVLRWLREYGESVVGVKVLQGEVQELDVVKSTGASEGYVRGVYVRLHDNEYTGSSYDPVRYALVEADNFVLAGGNIGGTLFESTNKRIAFSSQELGYKAGLGLVYATKQMIHPFGLSNSKGDSKLGCFETDLLVGVEVLLGAKEGHHGPMVLDRQITNWLARHEAHYHFPEIAERIMDMGGVVKLRFPDGSSSFARVSHHYSHIGLETVNGTRVKGIRNLYGAGDAVGPCYFMAGQERFPGVALLSCLVHAELIREQFAKSETLRGEHVAITVNPENYYPEYRDAAVQKLSYTRLSADESVGAMSTSDEHRARQINTWYLKQIIKKNSGADGEHAGLTWMNNLRTFLPQDGSSVIGDISLGMAYAYRRVWSGDLAEPIVICSELVNGLRQEGAVELTKELGLNRAQEIQHSYGGKERF